MIFVFLRYENVPVIPNGRSGKDNPGFPLSNDITFLKEDEEKLPDYVLAGIKKGQDDIQAGRTITLEEFKNRMSYSN